WNNMFPKGIFAWKILLREPLGHDANRRRIPIIVIGEHATASNRNPHRLKIVRRNYIELRDRLLSLRHRPLLEIEIERNVTTAQRNPPARGRRLDARQSYHSLEQFFVEISRLLRFEVACFGQREARRHHIRRVEASRNFLETNKTLGKQSRAGEKDKRENN